MFVSLAECGRHSHWERELLSFLPNSVICWRDVPGFALWWHEALGGWEMSQRQQSLESAELEYRFCVSVVSLGCEIVKLSALHVPPL